VKVKGRWTSSINFLLATTRDADATKRFFHKALAQSHTVNPRTISMAKNHLFKSCRGY
jgi:transposase, IS6 family